jgi:hypothetical protein
MNDATSFAVSPETMTQTAPYPQILADLVAKLKYRPGWTFDLEHVDRGQGSAGLTLSITTMGYNSHHLDEPPRYRVVHYMLVPPAAYNKKSWTQWLLDQCLLVERHEACEFFVIGGERIFAPHHGPGNDPYVVFTHGTDEDARTTFRGEVCAPK